MQKEKRKKFSKTFQSVIHVSNGRVRMIVGKNRPTTRKICNPLTLINSSAIILTVTIVLSRVIENLSRSQEIPGNFLESFRTLNLSQIRKKIRPNCKLLKQAGASQSKFLLAKFTIPRLDDIQFILGLIVPKQFYCFTKHRSLPRRC